MLNAGSSELHLRDIIYKNNEGFHYYVDDTQMHFNKSWHVTLLGFLFKGWNSFLGGQKVNRICLNLSPPELLLIGTRHKYRRVIFLHLHFDELDLETFGHVVPSSLVFYHLKNVANEVFISCK